MEKRMVLFNRKKDGEVGWFEDGDEDKDRKYVGEIENGKPNGKGTLKDPKRGRKYVGEVKDGLPHGIGKQTWRYDYMSYDGLWYKGLKHGIGTQNLGDGNIFWGNFTKGNQLGYGKKTYWKGVKEEGEFRTYKPWNVKIYDKDGNITGKYVNGVKTEMK